MSFAFVQLIQPLLVKMISLLLQESHNRVGRARIQSSGRFVKEENRRTDDELHTNVGSLALPSRNASDELGSDLCKGDCHYNYIHPDSKFMFDISDQIHTFESAHF
jgi:hypothetical protein